MKIKSVILENFRGYQFRQVINMSNFTAFVGKNDVGKSTVLEALDIFFNDGKGVVPMDVSDVNVNARVAAGNNPIDIVIGVTFAELPAEVVLDDNNRTNLSDEYLLDENGELTIIKKYPNGGKAKTFIYAYHPTNVNCCDLLTKKQTDLRRIARDLDCDHNVNASMRKAIRDQYAMELNCAMVEIEASKEDAKNIGDALKKYFPIYSLFQADRSNGDKDKEVQDPLKEAVKQVMSEAVIEQKCQEIYDLVLGRLQSVSDRTLAKIREMNPQLANTLHPSLPLSAELKWNDVFKSVSITGDDDIPINKRGSGVKRMVLLNFFRAEAELNQQRAETPGIVYAIEEPETAQHVEHQLLLIDALLQLSHNQSTQVIITTHSSTILKKLSFDNIRLVVDKPEGKIVENVIPSQLPYPSLNEIAFTSFGEYTPEYHDELYGHIEYEGWMAEYKNGKPQIQYQQLGRDRNLSPKDITLTEKIRHQIHHPENRYNPLYTKDELAESINDMRAFIHSKRVAL